MICRYWSTIVDRLDFFTAFTDPAALQLLPADLQAKLPIMVFKYGAPLERLWCNFATLAKTLTADKVAEIPR